MGGREDGGSARRKPPRKPQPNLRNIFDKVDSNGDGEISAEELQAALSNGDWSEFSPATVRLMVGIFDRDDSGGIGFEEFRRLWAYVVQWVDIFRRYDEDGSGKMDPREMRGCLAAFGYRLPPSLIRRLVRRYGNERSGLAFDAFILCCVHLQTLTSLFKEKDVRREGAIRVEFTDFIDMIMASSNLLVN